MRNSNYLINWSVMVLDGGPERIRTSNIPALAGRSGGRWGIRTLNPFDVNEVLWPLS